MRGADSYSENLFTTVKLEEFVPANHPLRPIRAWVNDALKCIEQCFGWGKLTLTMAAYNLTRLRTLANLRPQCAQ